MARFESVRADELGCLLSYLAMATVLVLWYGLWFPRGSVLVAHMVVLCISGASMIWRAHTGWLTLGGLTALGYFCYGVMEAYASPDQRVPALAVVLLSCAYFVSLAYYIRRQRAAKRALSPQPAESTVPGE